MDQYGEDLVDLGAWNDGRGADHGRERGCPGRRRWPSWRTTATSSATSIVGIEPGAGLTEAVGGRHGDPDLRAGGHGVRHLVDSRPCSTELKAALDAGEETWSVTLWRPALGVRRVPDPGPRRPGGHAGRCQKAIHSIARTGFAGGLPRS